MKKIAVILEGNYHDRKGYFNSILNRIKCLSKYKDLVIHPYLIQSYDGYFVRKLRKTKKIERPNSIIIEDVTYQMLWYKFSLIDYLLENKLKSKRVNFIKYTKSCIPIFQNFDLISAHSTYPGYLAYLINKKYNIPFTITWHGSDIHTFPFINKYMNTLTNILLTHASYNFFVSKNLLKKSISIKNSKFKCVLYNGVSDNFMTYSSEVKSKLKKTYEIEDKRVIAFVGGLVPIKNIDLLPEIFHLICNKKINVQFWIIGDGKLRHNLLTKLQAYNIPFRFWGNITPDKMPELLNCIDLLILPSKNEGLPLVTLEAIKCGSKVIGSKVGGIPEAIGEENTCILDSNFVYNISELAIYALKEQNLQQLDPIFNWDSTSKIEYSIYNSLIKL